MFCGCGVVRCFPFPSPAKWRSWGGKKKDGRCCWENNNNKQNNNRKLEKEGEKRSDETSKRKQSQPKQKSECAEWLAVQRQSGALRDNTNTRGKGEWRNKTKNKKQQQKKKQRKELSRGALEERRKEVKRSEAKDWVACRGTRSDAESKRAFVMTGTTTCKAVLSPQHYFLSCFSSSVASVSEKTPPPTTTHQ